MVLLEINWFNTTVITLLGFCSVLLVLILLILLLSLSGKPLRPRAWVPKIIRRSAKEKVEVQADTEYLKVDMPANASAAIAMALYLYHNEIHDDESYKVTIKKVDRKYSPWNSKIYGINNLHR